MEGRGKEKWKGFGVQLDFFCWGGIRVDFQIPGPVGVLFAQPVPLAHASEVSGFGVVKTGFPLAPLGFV